MEIAMSKDAKFLIPEIAAAPALFALHAADNF